MKKQTKINLGEIQKENNSQTLDYNQMSYVLGGQSYSPTSTRPAPNMIIAIDDSNLLPVIILIVEL